MDIEAHEALQRSEDQEEFTSLTKLKTSASKGPHDLYRTERSPSTLGER